MRDTRPYFERIGNQFEEWADPFDVDRRQELFARLISKFPPTGSCLEVGCGYGAMTQVFAAIFESLTVFDISLRLTKNVSAKHEVAGLNGDAVQMPFPDESIQNVVSSECIEHTGDPRRALGEMCRVLSPGGLIYISTPNPVWGPVIRLGSRLNIRKFKDKEVFVSARRIRLIMEAHHIEAVHIDSCHIIPWQLPLAKRLIRKTDRFGHRLHWFSVNIAVVGRKLDSDLS